MAEDEDVSRRYRELAREEPPRHLDEAIRAAARRAVNTRPAPLVVPTGRQRWYFPLAAAAIIVLALAVTLHIEREQPAEEIASTTAEPVRSQAEEPKQEQQARRERRDSSGARELRQATPAPAPEPQHAPAVSAPPPELGAAGTAMRRSEPPPAAAPLAKLADRSPEQWLQGIAELRAQARHDEADRELAEFRKRHPDYRIPETMLEKVEKR